MLLWIDVKEVQKLAGFDEVSKTFVLMTTDQDGSNPHPIFWGDDIGEVLFVKSVVEEEGLVDTLEELVA